MKLSIIIPSYNEEATIYTVLERVFEAELKKIDEKEIIVVNDCSGDNTDGKIKEFIKDFPERKITYISHEVNKGKGATIRSGIENATGDFTIIQDADLELDPNDINLLLQPVIHSKADVVYGSRFAGGKNPRAILTYRHNFANKFLTGLSNLFSNMNLTDMETCYKLIRTDVFKKITIKENRFGIEPEITAKLSKMKTLRFFEVGISYYPRSRAEGKKIGLGDGFRAIYCIVKYNIFP